MAASDFCSPSRCLDLILGSDTCGPWRSFPARGARHEAPRVLARVTAEPTRTFRPRRDADLSSSWVACAFVPRSLTPVVDVLLQASPYFCNFNGLVHVAFAVRYRLGGHNAEISELNHAAQMLAVYASQLSSPTPTQDSLPSRWLGATRTGLAPARQLHRISGLAHTAAPPSHRSKLLDAHQRFAPSTIFAETTLGVAPAGDLASLCSSPESRCSLA
jgi:hypothetical protein